MRSTARFKLSPPFEVGYNHRVLSLLAVAALVAAPAGFDIRVEGFDQATERALRAHLDERLAAVRLEGARIQAKNGTPEPAAIEGPPSPEEGALVQGVTIRIAQQGSRARLDMKAQTAEQELTLADTMIPTKEAQWIELLGFAVEGAAMSYFPPPSAAWLEQNPDPPRPTVQPWSLALGALLQDYTANDLNGIALSLAVSVRPGRFLDSESRYRYALRLQTFGTPDNAPSPEVGAPLTYRESNVGFILYRRVPFGSDRQVRVEMGAEVGLTGLEVSRSEPFVNDRRTLGHIGIELFAAPPPRIGPHPMHLRWFGVAGVRALPMSPEYAFEGLTELRRGILQANVGLGGRIHPPRRGP